MEGLNALFHAVLSIIAAKPMLFYMAESSFYN